MAAEGRRLSWWGWGWEDSALGDEDTAGVGRMLAAVLGVDPPPAPRVAPDAAALTLPHPRVSAPPALAGICRDDVAARAAHAQGKAFRDVVRAIAGRIDHPPDLVALPTSESDVLAVLEWCSAAGIAVIPYGGGTSVVGGVEPDVGERYAGAISLDLRGIARVLDVDGISMAVRVEAGMVGPGLEASLRRHGLTLRHFPQSFEFSTVGGWIATRSAGHFATLHTHIDDVVESLRLITPQGVLETRRLPASGAGPSPDRLLIGSEGTLGIVTEAWLLVLPRPRFRSSATVRFASFDAGVAACRAVAQSGLHPANCRLLDSTEALVSGAGDGTASLLLLAFESADHDVVAALGRGLELCADHGGAAPDRLRITTPATASDPAEDGASTWRSAFLRAPYLRDAIARLGWISETFETAVTWDRFATLHAAVTGAAREAVAGICGAGIVACRFSHLYPDGCAPYYTVIATGRADAQLEQWDAVKRAVSATVVGNGGTITHHHAVGRDHMAWYEQQRPPLFGDALRAAKSALDPAGILNPGVLMPLG